MADSNSIWIAVALIAIAVVAFFAFYALSKKPNPAPPTIILPPQPPIVLPPEPEPQVPSAYYCLNNGSCVEGVASDNQSGYQFSTQNQCQNVCPLIADNSVNQPTPVPSPNPPIVIQYPVYPSYPQIPVNPPNPISLSYKCDGQGGCIATYSNDGYPTLNSCQRNCGGFICEGGRCVVTNNGSGTSYQQCQNTCRLPLRKSWDCNRNTGNCYYVTPGTGTYDTAFECSTRCPRIKPLPINILPIGPIKPPKPPITILPINRPNRPRPEPRPVPRR